jgi:SAM-dependent methyltransferase
LNKEAAFHDTWAANVEPASIGVDILGDSPALPEIKFILKHLGPLKGKKILDIGCGCGEASVFFAKQGASVTAADISSEMLNLASKVAALHGVGIFTVKSDASRLELPDAEFDIVYLANLLHHVKLEATVTEAHRLLKPGGLFASWDPLKYNPVINIYRKIAAEVRTEDEHPLGRPDLALIASKFKNVKTGFFWLSALMIFLKYYFIDRLDPNKVRYWKKVIEDRDIDATYKLLAEFDRAILKVCPPLGWLCWNLAIVAEKDGTT